MYQAGEQVIYGMHGVCRVVQEEKRIVDRKTVTYLVLETVGRSGSRFYVPTHNAAAMEKIRPMLSAQELEDLLGCEEVLADGWIPVEGQRKQIYREILGSGDRVKVAQILRALYRHKAERIASGKKVHMCDDNFLRDAEKMLVSEAAIVRGCDLDAAKQYIRSKLKKE